MHKTIYTFRYALMYKLPYQNAVFAHCTEENLQYDNYNVFFHDLFFNGKRQTEIAQSVDSMFVSVLH